MITDISEAYIEKKLKPVIKQLKGEYWKLNIPGNAGTPDRLALLPAGRVYFLEIKRPKGGVLAPLQRIQHRNLRALGFQVRVVWTLADLNDFIYEISL